MSKFPDGGIDTGGYLKLALLLEWSLFQPPPPIGDLQKRPSTFHRADIKLKDYLLPIRGYQGASITIELILRPDEDMSRRL